MVKQLYFSELACMYGKLEQVSSGNRMREILSRFFKGVPKQDVKIAAYLTLGMIAPAYEDIKLGIAEKMLLKAIAAAAKKELDIVTELFKQTGDAGITAQQVIGKQNAGLTARTAFESLHRIAAASGTGSHNVKLKILAEMLEQASPEEAKYIARIALGTLRLGIGIMTVLDSLSIAFTGTKANKLEIERAYNVCPNIGLIAETVCTKGMAGIKRINASIGRPIQMMLAQRVKSITEISEKMGYPLTAEEKYDGERIQVHRKGSSIMLYSRKLENITSQFPDVVKQIRNNTKSSGFIAEGECVAVDKKGNLMPFQLLMQRRRKYNVNEYTKKIPVCLYLFDLLFLDGRSFIRKNYPERRRALAKITKETSQLQLAKRQLCSDIDAVEEFFNSSIERGAEGIIAKSCSRNSVYQAGTRGWLWIKWKQEYAKEMRETFDLAVIGAFAGKGKRGGTYGALLCAAYNRKNDRFETVCKLGSGFTDKQLAELPERFKKHAIKHRHALVEAHNNMKPDFWFEPAVVVEVLGAEITRSPIHTAAAREGKGLALRFPRFIKYRSDKSAEQATTVKEIEEMFAKKRQNEH